MKIKTILILASFSVLMPTCKSDLYNPDICFQEDVLPIFVSKCAMTECHSSNEKEAGYDLSNYDGIMKGITPNHPYSSEIYNQIRGNNPSMPVGQKLTNKELSYIKVWIKMGAKNSSNCSACDTSLYTYSGKIKPLFDTWCTGCHNAANPSGGYDFSTYSTTVVSITDGRLLGTLQHLTGFSAMPKGSPSLSNCDISAVEKWINANYPNN